MIGVIYLSTVSVVCGGFGLYQLWKRIGLFMNADRAVGEFVRWESQSRGATIYYYPVVRFEARDSKVYEFVAEVGSSSKSERKRYAILYPPDDPQAAMIHGFIDFWLNPLVFFTLAAGAAVAAMKQ